jgi:hypothetical protein
MDSKILLGKILQRFKDLGHAQVDGYNSFGYIRETDNAVIVTRQAGQDTPISFAKILTGIDAYKDNSTLYHSGPGALRDFGITHVNSPVFALLHLLTEEDFK